MRKVIKLIDRKPDILDFTKTPNTLVVLGKIIANQRVEDKHGGIYRGTYKDEQGITQSRVRDELNKIYHEKCAYCESFESSAQIEHYRPKNKVTKAGTNKGYFWLCFEWTNLLPACFGCNKIGTGKGNKFPIISQHQRKFGVPLNPDQTVRLDDFDTNASYLLNERPFLLHPEYDEPKLYFKFEWTQSNTELNIVGIDIENRGNETIKICDLNRKNLRKNRGIKLYDVVIEPLQASLALFRNRQKTSEDFSLDINIIFNRIKKRANNAKEEFTLMWWYIFENTQNFEAIVGATLPLGTQRTVVMNLFQQFKDSN